MRLWLRIVLGVLALLLIMPAIPAVNSLVLSSVASAAGIQLSFASVRGYLPFSVAFRDLEASGPGFSLEAERVSASYLLISLLWGDLPLSLHVEQGELELIPLPATQGSGGGGGSPPIVIRPREVTVKNFAVVSGGTRYALPELELKLAGGGDRYQFAVELAGGSLAGNANFRDYQNLGLDFEGDLTALDFLAPQIKGGTLSGEAALVAGVPSANLATTGGKVDINGLVGEDLALVAQLAGGSGSAELAGNLAGGPLSAQGKFSLDPLQYSFTAQASPELAELAQSYLAGADLQGQGQIQVEGSGAPALELSGGLSASGRVYGEPLELTGKLEFKDKFIFNADLSGNLPYVGRAYSAGFSWDDGWGLQYSDEAGSSLEAHGEGEALRGEGELFLPTPLAGSLAFNLAGDTSAFRAEGGSFRADLTARELTLPAGAPINDQGSLLVRAGNLSGGLGPLAVSGNLSSWQLQLKDLPVALGQISGTVDSAPLAAGLQYSSPYSTFPLNLRSGAKGLEFDLGPYGTGRVVDGNTSVMLSKFPLNIGAPHSVSAQVLIGQVWSGNYSLSGEYLNLNGSLFTGGTDFSGEATTSLGDFPLVGRAGPEGVSARLDQLAISATDAGISAQGSLNLEQIALNSDFSYRDANFSGSAEISSPWLNLNVSGEGPSLAVTTSGYASLSGQVYPDLNLQGQLTLPESEFFSLPALPLSVDQTQVRLGEGRIGLSGSFPFQLEIPLLVAGREVALSANGNQNQGNLALKGEGLELALAGPWSGVSLNGQVEVPTLGPVNLSGNADLLALRYDLALQPQQLAGAIQIAGTGAELSYQGRLQSGGTLDINGDLGKVALQAQDFSLAPFGFAGTLAGNLSYGPDLVADLSLSSQYLNLSARGQRTLNLALAGPYANGYGQVSLSEINLNSELTTPWLNGNLRVSGPWQNLAASGAGNYTLPVLASEPWRLAGAVTGGDWQLSGPLELQGTGAEITGKVNWPYQWQEQAGVLSGELALSGGVAQAQLNTTLAQVPLMARVTTAGGLTASLQTPAGQLDYRAGQISTAGFGLAPVGQVLGVPLSGQLAGTLNLTPPEGRISGLVQAYGRNLEVAVFGQNQQLQASVLETELDLGLEANLAAPIVVRGFGAASGEVQLGQNLAGQLVYKTSEIQADLALAGTSEVPALKLNFDGFDYRLSARLDENQGRVLAQGPGLDLRGEGNVQDQSYWAEVIYDTNLARANLKLSGKGADLTGAGELETRSYLPQAGPITIKGQGGNYSLLWQAPLQIEAGYGPGGIQVATQGSATVEAAGFTSALQSDLSYGPGFSGSLTLNDPQNPALYQLKLDGAGDTLQITGRHAATPWLYSGEGQASGQVDTQGIWRINYQGDGLGVRASGEGGTARVALNSPYGQGGFSLGAENTGNLQLNGVPIAPLDASADLGLTLVAGQPVGQLLLQRQEGNLRLRAQGGEYQVLAQDFALAGLPVLSQQLPGLTGRLFADLSYGSELSGWVGLTNLTPTAPPLRVDWVPGSVPGLSGRFGESRFNLSLPTGHWLGQASLRGFPLSVISELTTGTPVPGAYLTGSLDFDLPSAAPLQGQATLAGERLELGAGPEALVGSLAANLAAGRLELATLDLQSPSGGDLEARGAVGQGQVNLNLNGRQVPLGPLLALWPPLATYAPSGQISLQAQIQDQSANVLVEPLSLNIAGIDITSPRLALTMNGSVVAEGDIVISPPYASRLKLSGQGSGQAFSLNLAGEATLPGVGSLDGLAVDVSYPDLELSIVTGQAQISGSLSPLDLRAEGKLPLADPSFGLHSGEVEIDLGLSQFDDTYRLGGDINILRATVGLPQGSQAEGGEAAPAEEGEGFPLYFDSLRIRGERGILVDEGPAQGELSADLTIQGPLASMLISGEVGALRGTIDLWGHTFTILPSSEVDYPLATFTGALYPRVHLEAVTSVTSDQNEPVDVLLTADASFEPQPDGRYILTPDYSLASASNPEYGQDQLLSLLAFGTADMEFAAGGVTQGALGSVESLVGAQIGRELADALGVDVFRIESGLLEGGGLEATRFTVGTYLTQDLFVSLGAGLEGDENVAVEYRLGDFRFSARTVFGAEAQPESELSVLYAVQRNLDLSLTLGTEQFGLGAEWRF